MDTSKVIVDGNPKHKSTVEYVTIPVGMYFYASLNEGDKSILFVRNLNGIMDVRCPVNTWTQLAYVTPIYNYVPVDIEIITSRR